MRVTIKAARVNKDMTQEVFANAVGVGVRTVQNWEAGVSSPRADKMPEICAVLDCKIDDIAWVQN